MRKLVETMLGIFMREQQKVDCEEGSIICAFLLTKAAAVTLQ
jgi:hypothetical protein